MAAPLKPTALIVDDSSVSRAILSKMLNKGGVDTHEVSNGQDALNKCRSTSYRIIFMDLEMPGMNGEVGDTALFPLTFTAPSTLILP
jgi:CheY-like chemotaxis protein